MPLCTVASIGLSMFQLMVGPGSVSSGLGYATTTPAYCYETQALCQSAARGANDTYQLLADGRHYHLPFVPKNLEQQAYIEGASHAARVVSEVLRHAGPMYSAVPVGEFTTCVEKPAGVPYDRLFDARRNSLPAGTPAPAIVQPPTGPTPPKEKGA